MKIVKDREIAKKSEMGIITATQCSESEVVILMTSGKVVRFDFINQERLDLFSVDNGFSYSDGGFDLSSKSTFYTMDSIVVIVNDYKLHGFVHYPGKYRALHLWRKDYHADLSRFPIALFKNEGNVPHLVYGEAWNHLNIMNLDTRQVLTADKSLIETGAEESHINFYKKHQESNKLPWPRPYDYFYGRLEVSPNNRYFLSAGWSWGSYDSYKIYGIEHFIKSNRISEIVIGAWEHSNRGICWIDNSTLAITYSPFEEEEENAQKDSPHEIHFYSFSGTEPEIEKKIKIFEFDIVGGEIHFCDEHKVLIHISEKNGLLVISLTGEILLQENGLAHASYNQKFNTIEIVENGGISIFKLIEE